MDQLLKFIRGLIRPLVTEQLVLAMIIFTALGVSIPDKLWDITIMAMSFWFADRLLRSSAITDAASTTKSTGYNTNLGQAHNISQAPTTSNPTGYHTT